ncbi:RGS domain-containing protein [Madurella fahalii]|uniref:RGS domain-containing protein n=1 Tax=Madurella fahalii TaxID=1157608 RepID=A0ABQ0GNA5_9PEZI
MHCTDRPSSVVLPTKSDPTEPSTPGHPPSRRGSTRLKPVLVLPCRSDPSTAGLSPPLVSRSARVRSKNTRGRLRSGSGLSLHTNHGSFRQYTGYNSGGSVPSGPCHRKGVSYDESSSVDTPTFAPRASIECKELASQCGVLPDFFGPVVIKAAFSNPATRRKLCSFARNRHTVADIGFLFKVEEYSRVLGDLTFLMSHIWIGYTSPTATSPLGLDPELSRLLSLHTKDCARSSIPALEQLYDEAKGAVQERLARSLYPEFVKYQLSQRLRDALSAASGKAQSAYPGLGDAFCITDALRPDNPVAYASDGLLAMSGYGRSQVINKNCRFLQGIATCPEAILQLSEAVSGGREVAELIVNHRPDGTPYWNLLFICPLMENGTIRYFFGAQVNVSDSTESDYGEVLRLLNYGPPAGDSSPPNGAPQSEDAVLQENSPDQPAESLGRSAGRGSRRQRLYRFFSRKSTDSAESSPPSTRLSAASNFPLDCDSTPITSPNTSSPPVSPQTPCPTEGYTTPYSHFLVLRYISNPQTPGKQCQLPISHCSSPARSLLNANLKFPLNDINGRDIFSVLPSVNSHTWHLKTAVLDQLQAGRSATTDMPGMTSSSSSFPNSSPDEHRHQQGAKTGKGRNGRPPLRHARTAAATTEFRAGGSAGAKQDLSGPIPSSEPGCIAGSGSGDVRPRLSETWDRGREMIGEVFSRVAKRSASAGPVGVSGTGRVVGHWVPLKDGEGEVGMVVLVLVPALGAW